MCGTAANTLLKVGCSLERLLIEHWGMQAIGRSLPFEMCALHAQARLGLQLIVQLGDGVLPGAPWPIANAAGECG